MRIVVADDFEKPADRLSPRALAAASIASKRAAPRFTLARRFAPSRVEAESSRALAFADFAGSKNFRQSRRPRRPEPSVALVGDDVAQRFGGAGAADAPRISGTHTPQTSPPPLRTPSSRSFPSPDVRNHQPPLLSTRQPPGERSGDAEPPSSRDDRASEIGEGRRFRRRGTQRRRSQFVTIAIDVGGAELAAGAGLARARDVRCAMTDVIVEIVDRLIAAEEKMLDSEDYDWPTSRAALERILADLEARSLGHPDLKRLRWFIAISEEAWKARLRSKNG